MQPIRVGHSPDPDDAFMFYALAKGKIDTGRYRFAHELVDIETLNRRAFAGELELTAVSVHAYAYLSRPLHPLLLRGEHGRPLRADGRRPAEHDARRVGRRHDRRAGAAHHRLSGAAALPGRRFRLRRRPVRPDSRRRGGGAVRRATASTPA